MDGGDFFILILLLSIEIATGMGAYFKGFDNGMELGYRNCKATQLRGKAESLGNRAFKVIVPGKDIMFFEYPWAAQ